MNLYSANSSANWHPLTSLISFDSLKEREVHYFFPAIDGTPDYFSNLLHEITHLMSARYGRFGLYLARIATREYVKWTKEKSPTLSLSQSEQNVLGAFTPLLEGVALYTQLDFEAEDNEGPHYSPLYIIASLVISDHVLSTESLSERYRIWRSCASGGRRKTSSLESFVGWSTTDIPLLEVLLLDKTREDLTFYTFGYLYIKALQADWANKCSAFSKPSIFLPFVNKLINEHPILTSALTENFSTREIISSIHKTLSNLSSSDLNLINNFFVDNQTLEEFDKFDVYGHLESRSSSSIPTHDLNYLLPFFYDKGDEEQGKMSLFRASNHIYIHSWCEGVLQFPTQSAHDAILETSEGEVELRLPSMTKVWYEDWKIAIKEERDESQKDMQIKVGNILLGLEQIFFKTLSSAEGKHVCIANFITTFRSYVGVCIWIDNEFVALKIDDPWQLLKAFKMNQEEEDLTFLGAGLSISPPDRISFANAFVNGEPTLRHTRAAGEYLLEYLVSDPTVRQTFWKRLTGIWKGNLADAIKWASGFPSPYPLPEHLNEKAKKVFDFPGFSLDTKCKIQFGDLLPKDYSPITKN